MADKTPPAPPPVPQGPSLEPDDVIGIIRRTLDHLDNYTRAPSHAIDREVVYTLLQKISYWLGWLPPMKAANDTAEGAKRKAG